MGSDSIRLNFDGSSLKLLHGDLGLELQNENGGGDEGKSRKKSENELNALFI